MMSHAKDAIHKYSHLFKKEAYTEREAFLWLIENNENGKITYSIRSLAKTWNWSEATARRFVTKLGGAAVIDAQSDARGTVITLHESLLEEPGNLKVDAQTDAVIDAPNDDLVRNNSNKPNSDVPNDVNNEAVLPQDSCGPELNNVALSYAAFDVLNVDLKPTQLSDTPYDAVNGDTSSLIDCSFSSITEALTNAADDAAEHLSLAVKKKEKKQKKEKTIKEKNTPFRGLKKEKFLSENQVIQASVIGSILQKQVKFSEVKAEHIENWVAKQFPESFNLQWELEKFKDYWLASHKKPPKDGIAAFRNWLRKAYEFKQIKEIKHGKHNKTTTTDSLHNFMQAGAKIIARYNRH